LNLWNTLILNLEASALHLKFETSNLPPLLFEMLNSFSTLATTQNLSEAVIALGLSRQTIRRHVVDLEEVLGEQLLRLENRRYELTVFGATFAKDARAILSRVDDLVSGTARNIQHLSLVRYRISEESYFLAKQHSVLSALDSEIPLVSQIYQFWCDARGRLNHALMQAASPYLVIYRQQRNDWTCVHVGECSSMATWLGGIWAKSEVGTLISEDALSNATDRFVTEAYQQVVATGSPRFDHIATKLPRSGDSKNEPINYQRLLLPCQFPNSRPALVVLTARTNKLDVGGESFELMDDAWCMDFEGLKST
jgi:hypothetical protein